MKLRTKLFKGFGSVAAFLCALFIGVNGIASSADYKGTVDSVLGGASSKAGSSEAYAFTSEYDSVTDMLTERVRIAEQISEEGSVLLKNDDNALPLNGDGSHKNVTVLGNRPYTYKTDGTLRDSRLTFYGGITGSVIYEQNVTINTESGGTETIHSPVTLEQALESENISINPAMKNFYSDKAYSPYPQGSEAADSGGGAYSIDEPSVSINDTGNYQSYSDACIVVIGRTSGEGRDYLPGKSGVKDGSTQTSAIGLSDEERNLIDVANQISPGKVIVLINSAVAMEIDELKNNDKVNSILWIGLPGSYGLNGVARVISGKASPSGRLSDTYAVSASNAPAAQNFGSGDPSGTSTFTWSNGGNDYVSSSNGHYVVMAESIYTGYYYYETRYSDYVFDALGLSSTKAASAKGATDNNGWEYKNEVSYSFGYGLSYTTFTEEIVTDSFVYDDDEETISLKVKVTNTGNYEAKHSVTLYVQTPYTDYDKQHEVEKSAVQLVAFAKTETLKPQESEEIELTADIKYFASYDETYSHDGVTGGYILDDGDYYFAVGNGAHAALNNILANCLSVSTENLDFSDGETINANSVYTWDISAQKKNKESTEFAFSFDSATGIDGLTFAKSESGTTVQNQMQDTDYNNISGKDGTVTYLSRTDWEGTFPKSYTRLEVTSDMESYLILNSSVYKVGSSTVNGVSETLNANVQFDVDHEEEEDEDTGMPMENTDIASYKGKSFDDEEWDYLLQQITFEEAYAFAPLGGTSCEPFSSVNAPRVWQIDGPNGNVNRGYSSLAPTTGTMAVSSSDANAGYKSADMPCEPTVAATFNAELLEEEGKIFGEDTLWSRNPIMWAPGMNLHRTAFNSRNHEYYSEDPVLTNKLGTAFVRGGLSTGAILAAKHYAFNTQESYREGLCQFFNEQSGREMELRAFQGLAEDVNYENSSGNKVNALGLMSSFSRVGVCGVNAHTGIMKNVLRGEWGFKGLISTDMVSRSNFFNATDCVINNVTFMATDKGETYLNEWASTVNYEKSAIQNDSAMMNALYENMHYYMYSIANSNALNGYAPGDTVETSMSWWQIMLISLSAISGAAAVVLVVLSVVLDRTSGSTSVSSEENVSQTAVGDINGGEKL